MTGPQLITQMRARCLLIEGRLADYANKLAADQSLLVHYRATLADLEGDVKGHRTPSSMSVARLFERGEAFARCVVAFRELGPELTTTELAAYCLRSKSQDPSDKQLSRAMAQQLIEILKLREKKGEIVAAGKRGVVKVWKLPL